MMIKINYRYKNRFGFNVEKTYYKYNKDITFINKLIKNVDELRDIINKLSVCKIKSYRIIDIFKGKNDYYEVNIINPDNGEVLFNFFINATLHNNYTIFYIYENNERIVLDYNVLFRKIFIALDASSILFEPEKIQ